MSVRQLLGRLALALWVMSVLFAMIIAPSYLLAVFPELPQGPAGRLFGISLTSPALLNFWFRLAFCAAAIALGVVLLYATLRSWEARR